MPLHVSTLFAVLFLAFCYTVADGWVRISSINSISSGCTNLKQSRGFGLCATRDVLLRTPDSIAAMMLEVAQALQNAKALGERKILRVDVPLPVTGGTELDDWPGGIKQKYATLFPMLAQTMRALNFTEAAINERRYLDGAGEDDAIGIWGCNGFQLVSFPTPESIPSLQQSLQWADGSTILAIVNSQIFLNALSKQQSKDFEQQLEVAYQLENVNSRGPGSLPVRGLIYRKYPGPYKVARRLDGGGYVLLKEFAQQLPSREELDRLFFVDSEERDKNLSFLDRIKKQVPNFGS